MNFSSAEIKELNTLLSSWFEARIPRNGTAEYDSSKTPSHVAEFAGRIYKRGIARVKDVQGVHDFDRVNESVNLIPPLETLSRDAFLELIKERKDSFFIIDKNLSHFWKELQLPNAFIVDATESNKSLEYAFEILAKVPSHCDSFFACGGGVVLDLGGFVAGVLKKPVEYLSTTMLSSLDAAVGGKTGVNHPVFGKNQLGLFVSVKTLFVVPEYFKSLSEREIASGLAEAAKHAWLFGTFGQQESLIKDALTQGHKTPAQLISELVTINYNLKASLVKKDPYEANLRKYLNFGHTIGHVIEGLGEEGFFEKVPHGTAVAIGMHALIKVGLVGASPRGFMDLLELIIKKSYPRFPIFLKKPSNQFVSRAQVLLTADKKNESTKQGADFVLPSYAEVKRQMGDEGSLKVTTKFFADHVIFARLFPVIIDQI